jgi:hypothetical protein
MAPPPVDLYPPAPKTTLLKNAKLNGAVTAAVGAVSSGRSQAAAFALTLVDLSPSSGPLPMGSYKGDEEHYIASMAKVGVMYSAYALRDMVRRYVAKQKPATAEALFTGLAADMDDAIVKSSAIILSAPVLRAHRVPHYADVIDKTGATAMPEFRKDFLKALEKMIVPSDNTMAGKCVHGVGYSYLNGALEAAKLFTTGTKQGMWVAGDFSGGKNWPYARIPSTNDGDVAQASTSEAAALLLAVILKRGAIDTKSCDEMTERLARAAKGIDPDGQGDESWLTRSDIPGHLDLASVTHDKVGLGPLKKGADVYSELLALQNVGGSTRTYAVAFQNFVPGVYRWADLVAVIRNAIKTYETP